MAPISEEQLEKFRADHGEIWHVRGTPVIRKLKEPAAELQPDGTTKMVSEREEIPWEIAFKKPARKDYKFFKAQTANPAKAHDAQETLLRSCILVPALAGFDALLERFPGIPECPAVNSALTEALGMDGEDAEGKK